MLFRSQKSTGNANELSSSEEESEESEAESDDESDDDENTEQDLVIADLDEQSTCSYTRSNFCTR